jgi:3-oxoacyl-[acyl-carrier protein] reductase
MSNKTALITGAARGIGRAVAEELAQKGFDIAIADILPNADTTVGECGKHGVKAEFIRTDISQRDAREQLINRVNEEFGRLDLLVNNAGVSVDERKDLLEASEASYDRVMNINLKGPFFLTQLAAKWMIRQKNEDPDRTPMIVNIASLTSYASATSMAEYCLSKTGVSMMTKLYADRLSEHGILVYEIRPGIVKTDMTAVVREKYDRFIEDGGLPIQRWGYPADIARAISALAEGYLRYSTGEVLNVDGGFHLRRL